MDDKALVNVDMDMLDTAVESDKGGSSSVMDSIHTLKIYNPPIGKEIDESLARKFKLKLANSGTEEIIEGPIKFNPLSLRYFISGSVYPILDNGSISNEKIFFTTNEFGKYAKKDDTIGLAAKGKALGFFTKSEFEAMIKCKNLNGKENQFYDKKKDKDGKPYDGSFLSKGSVIYGQFVGGEHDKEYFRYFTNPKNLGVTWKKEGDKIVNIDAEPMTFEYAIKQGLDPMNDLLSNNGKKTINNIDMAQVDLTLDIMQNDKKNFMPVFEYDGLVAMRGWNNTADKEFIESLQRTHFESIFGGMESPSKLLIEGTNASGFVKQPQLALPNGEMSAEDVANLPDNELAGAAADVFGDTVEAEIVDTPIKDKDLSTPDF